jgi:hypothetical protein
MAQPFIPILPSAKETPGKDGLGVVVRPTSSEKGPGFRPLTGSVPQDGPAQSPGNGAPDAPPHPTVHLKRDGDRITQIQICCACGQVIELDCEY